MTQDIRTFYFSNMKSELKGFSQTDRVSKFCMDAGCISIVEVGQWRTILCKGLS